jgi:hypothetical protein
MSLPVSVLWTELSELIVMPNTLVCKVFVVVTLPVVYKFKIYDRNKQACILQPFGSVCSPKEWTVGILQQVGGSSVPAWSWFTLVLQQQGAKSSQLGTARSRTPHTFNKLCPSITSCRGKSSYLVCFSRKYKSGFSRAADIYLLVKKCLVILEPK